MGLLRAGDDAGEHVAGALKAVVFPLVQSEGFIAGVVEDWGFGMLDG